MAVVITPTVSSIEPLLISVLMTPSGGRSPISKGNVNFSLQGGVKFNFKVYIGKGEQNAGASINDIELFFYVFMEETFHEHD